MRRLLAIMLMVFAASSAWAAGGGGDLMDARVDVSDQSSLQRGAKLFANNCMGCHSAKYVRWNALPEALGVSMEMVESNLIYGSYTPGDTINAAMRSADAADWFGAAPPDLSLTARARGADWVYTYLNSFYEDPDASGGWNNTVLANSSMPHVLWRMQGVPEARYEAHNGEQQISELVIPAAQAGTLSEAEYQRVTRDITNFMAFMAEPVRAKRQEMGIWVIGFLVIFTTLAYLLKREYWRDIH